MHLVVDANVVFSTLISLEGKTADLFFSDKFHLISPEFLLDEINKYKSEIIKKSNLSEVELDLALSIIFAQIELVSFQDFEKFISQSKEICPDPKDIEYFALALSLKCPLWSNDKKLKEQNVITVYATHDLIKS